MVGVKGFSSMNGSGRLDAVSKLQILLPWYGNTVHPGVVLPY